MILEFLFAIACKDAGSQVACQKAMEASSKQSQVYQSVEYMERVAKLNVTKVTGDKVWGVALVGWKVYRDRALTYSFKPHTMVDNVSLKAGYDKSGSIALQWRF